MCNTVCVCMTWNSIGWNEKYAGEIQLIIETHSQVVKYWCCEFFFGQWPTQSVGIWRPGNETIQSSMFLVYLTSHTFWKWFFFWQLNVMYVPLSSHHQDFWKKCTILVKRLYLFDYFTKITCVAAFLHWICIGKKSHILMTEWCVCNVSGQCVVLAELRTQSSRQAADSLFTSVRINN